MADYDQDEEMVTEEPQQPQRLKSMVSTDKKQKGRGFNDSADARDRYGSSNYESLGQSGKAGGPAKSVEGWVVFVTGVQEEAQEEDIQETFSEYGNIKNIYLNLDRQTGFVKGYALVEYANKNEAAAAIEQLDGKELLTQQINVSWAFSTEPAKRGGGRSRR